MGSADMALYPRDTSTTELHNLGYQQDKTELGRLRKVQVLKVKIPRADFSGEVFEHL